MSFVIANSPTRARAIRERDAAHTDTDHDREPEPSGIWVLLEALADAAAFIDPTGVLAGQRFTRIRNRRNVVATGESAKAQTCGTPHVRSLSHSEEGPC